MSIEATVFMTLLWKDKKIYRTTIQDTYDTADDEIEFLKAIQSFYINNELDDNGDEYFTLEDMGKYTLNILAHYDDIMQFLRNNYEDHAGSIHAFVNFELPCDNYFTTIVNYKNIFNNEHDEIEYINKHIYGVNNISDLLESIENIGKTKELINEKETMDECCVCYTDVNTYTNCNHCICVKCVVKLKENVCPLCRKDLYFNTAISD
jgi:hypothetical protein